METLNHDVDRNEMKWKDVAFWIILSIMGFSMLIFAILKIFGVVI